MARAGDYTSQQTLTALLQKTGLDTMTRIDYKKAFAIQTYGFSSSFLHCEPNDRHCPLLQPT